MTFLPYSGVEPDRSPFRFTAIKSRVIATYSLRKYRHRHGSIAACNHELHWVSAYSTHQRVLRILARRKDYPDDPGIRSIWDSSGEQGGVRGGTYWRRLSTNCPCDFVPFFACLPGYISKRQGRLGSSFPSQEKESSRIEL